MPDTATKPKKTRTNLTYELLTPRLNGNGEKVGYDIVPTPSNVKKDKPRRDDFERGVKAALEAGNEAAEAYNDKPLLVAAFGPGFCYTAKVEEVTVRKVKVSKVSKVTKG